MRGTNFSKPVLYTGFGLAFLVVVTITNSMLWLALQVVLRIDTIIELMVCP